MFVGDVPANPGAGLPPINLEDGPQGVADGVTQVTCWPSALTVVQTWDPQAMYDYGEYAGRYKVRYAVNHAPAPAAQVWQWGRSNTLRYGAIPCVAGVAMRRADIMSCRVPM